MLSLWMIGTDAARLFFLVTATIAAVLVAVCVAMILGVLRMPGAIPPRTPDEQAVVRRFMRVLAAEVVALILVGPVCLALRRPVLIVPLSVLIVGVHFLPLAWVFRVPRYYPLGLLFCAAVLLTLLMFPEDAHLGQATAWYVVPSMGCAPVAWLTAGANLREVSQFVRKSA